MQYLHFLILLIIIASLQKICEIIKYKIGGVLLSEQTVADVIDKVKLAASLVQEKLLRIGGMIE